jgi:Na+-transporting NADH:ubiquinone oxidoreductase subunit NqrB
MAKKKPTYTWNQETGEATYTIYYKNLTFTGNANCHPDDEDMKNQMMGLTIAESRATLAYLRHVRDNDLRPQLKSLKQLMYSMNHSKQYNRKSYEARMLYRHIQMLEEDMKNIAEDISRIKYFLWRYMLEKEELHQTLREKRKAKSDQENTSEN